MAETRRDFLKSAVAAGIGASANGPLLRAAAGRDNPPSRPPNILLLFPDQWRFDWMSDNPRLPIRTPHLDRLRAHGVQFHRALVAAPVCGPSRACLASGMEYERAQTPSNDYVYPDNLPTFYQRLREAGYHVLGCGKMDLAKGAHWWGTDGRWKLRSWGFSSGINNAGKWDQIRGLSFNDGIPPDPYTSFLHERGLLETHVHDYGLRRRNDYVTTFPTPLPDDAYCDNWITGNALQLLQGAPDKPWFLQVNWTGPHDPDDITRRMEATVRGRSMPPVAGKNQFSDDVNQRIRQNYTAMCENIDRGVGQLLAWLDASGQTDNTLVLFSSDHGEMLGDHGRWGKSVPYHPAASVPLLISGPGVQQGARSSALVSSIDLTATILDYGGAGQAPIDGRSLRPVLDGRSQTHRRVVYSGLGAWRLAFDGRYKVITGFAPELKQKNGANMSKYEPEVLSRPPLVFDLNEDPAEMRNLAGSMPEAAKMLLKDVNSGQYPA